MSSQNATERGTQNGVEPILLIFSDLPEVGRRTEVAVVRHGSEELDAYHRVNEEPDVGWRVGVCWEGWRTY